MSFYLPRTLASSIMVAIAATLWVLPVNSYGSVEGGLPSASNDPAHFGSRTYSSLSPVNARSRFSRPIHLAHREPGTSEDNLRPGIYGLSREDLVGIQEPDREHTPDSSSHTIRGTTDGAINPSPDRLVRGVILDQLTVLWIRGVELVVQKKGALFQIIQVAVQNSGAPVEADVLISGMEPVRVTLGSGETIAEVPVPAVQVETEVDIIVDVGGQQIAQTTELLEPIRAWTVYLLPHSHVDIGFTHLQSDVEQLHWGYFEQAIEASRETADFPTGSAFKWNVEVLWAVESYLKQATKEKKDEFIDAVRRGWIGLDALYANMLTGLCSEEELIHILDFARRLEREYGLTIDSAMISDVPGYTWGMIPVLADSGVRYWSIAPNPSFRIGNTFRALSDRPFYWVSASGERDVLVWVHGGGYPRFALSPIRDGTKVIDYLEELIASDYPYDIAMMRYVLFDNGPPDPGMTNFIREWNEQYVVPKLVIATTSEAFMTFEERFGDRIPALAGDFTPYWEDGAASSARETALNRASSERLVQAERLWAMFDPAAYPADRFTKAWRNVILFHEHTWGSWTSISEPASEFTLAQWDTKQGFALDADSESRALLQEALNHRASPSDEVSLVEVINTSSWSRSDLILLPEHWKLPGELVIGPGGEAIASQRLSTGELAFVAESVPPFSASTFSFHPGQGMVSGSATAGEAHLSSENITINLDATTGAIRSLRFSGIPLDLVNLDGGLGLNDYLYVAGRDPAALQRNGPVIISIKENGPLVATLVVDSNAPGTRGLRREIQIVSGLGRVDITNIIDKEEIFEAEAVHMAFPFNVPSGVVRMDIPWAVLVPDQNQLDGSNKNHFAVNRWVDISNNDFGVTMSSVDAPLFEVGAIAADPLVVGWLEDVGMSTTLYSYVMNNYWELNYKAAQEGPTTFRYSIAPHGPFAAAATARFGAERSQPLILIPVEATSPRSSFLSVTPPDVLVTSLKPSDDGKAWILRLFGASGQTKLAQVRWGDADHAEIWTSNLKEEQLIRVIKEVAVPGYGMVTLRVPRNPESPNGQCFIATAAYGTPLAAEIEVFRSLRDEYLLHYPVGTVVVDSYYRLSPTAADIIASDSTLRAGVRVALIPFLILSRLSLRAPEAVIVFSLLAFLVLARQCWRKTHRERKSFRWDH